MKSLFSAALFLILASQALFAQTDSLAPAGGPPGRWEILYAGGLGLPYLPQELRESYQMGWTVSMGGGYVFTPGDLGYAGLYGIVSFHNFPFDEGGFKAWHLPTSAPVSIDGASTQILTVMGIFKGTFSSDRSSIAPFFEAGIGYLHVFTPPVTVQGIPERNVLEVDEGEFAWTVGLGVDIPIGKSLTVFLDGKTVLGVTALRTTQFFPISLGIRGGI